MAREIAPIHPGEILKEDYLDPMNITVYRLAKDINVPTSRIAAIVKGERNLTADTALRLDTYFGLSRGFWLAIQNHYDTDVTLDRIEDELASIHPHAQAS